MVFYIAGKMNGLPDYGRSHFEEAAERLRAEGYTVLNPAELPVGLSPEKYMPICVAMIEAADALYMLTGWERSPGAHIELRYARYQGKAIVYEAEALPEGRRL